ncbi:MAG: glycosyltransferase [Cyanobacteria bacterium P01_E01_bin.48]
MSADTIAISVAIPTYNRVDDLLESLSKILACNPQPAEILVHIDGDDAVTQEPLEQHFPQVKILRSDRQMGPGGGRNKLIAAASYPIVACFDDDSYPLDTDYFQRVQTLCDRFPAAAVIGAAIYHIGEPVEPDTEAACWVADFTGCGCAYRRDVFNGTTGYVSLPVAYGMEEVDLNLRLHASGWKILGSSWLRVFHNTRLEHHESPKITAASVANQALLAFLRYPVRYWWLGAGQCVSRVLWLLRNNRRHGILRGLAIIPSLTWQHRQHRQTVSGSALMSYLHLRRNPIPIKDL